MNIIFLNNILLLITKLASCNSNSTEIIPFLLLLSSSQHTEYVIVVLSTTRGRGY